MARALLKILKILLFDEITSALDEKTSYEIFQTLIKLKKTHTILMISINQANTNSAIKYKFIVLVLLHLKTFYLNSH
ncbi:MAG: hypothetical protein ACLRQF_17125 [Thomasclavelia ramosa]